MYRSIFNNGVDFERMLDRLSNDGMTYKSISSFIEDDDDYDVNYTKDGAYLFFNVPGFNKSTLKVELDNGIIDIQGSRTYKLNGEEKTKKLSKQFKIGNNFNDTLIEATTEDGILTIFVPNYKKETKKTITIN
jgi:HSP20 family molecular chaperone IbpA